MFFKIVRIFIALLLLPHSLTLTAFCSPSKSIAYYDMTPLFQLDLNDGKQLRRFYDETMLAVCLQGLANREEPQLYIRYNKEPDDFWLERMTEDKSWMHGRKVETIDSLDELLKRFQDVYLGLVVWDEKVPATSNLAATIAGCENLLAVRYDENVDSLYQKLLKDHSNIHIVQRLIDKGGSSMFTGKGNVPGTSIPSSGSAKCDAYLWSVENCVKSGKVNPQLMGYYLDSFWLKCWFVSAPQNHTLTNLDFIIANRGVCFDLNVWEDEATVDDPNQKPGTDVRTLKKLLRSMYDRFDGNGMIHAAGFTPWAYKYTDYNNGKWNAGGKYGGVPTEWKYAEILSCYNAYMDADALGLSAMANASFFQHYPLPDFIPQNPKPTAESLAKQGILDESGRIVPAHYIAHYVGDYDSAAWLYQMLPRMWTDENRGKVPLSWAFNPDLAVRFPLGMHWSRERRTENDYFVAGDSGAGYLNPGLLSDPRTHSGLPSGMAAWERHCVDFFKQWDISLTGFVIDGNGPGLSEEGLDAYAQFSPDGIVPQKIPPMGVHDGMPYIRMGGDLPGDAMDAARVIRGGVRRPFPRFSVVRSILKTPSWYVRVQEEVKKTNGNDVRFVDLYTLLWLAKEYQTHLGDYNAEASPYAQSQSIGCTPDETNGLQAVFVADGPFKQVEKKGETCWLTPRHSPSYYLYFDAVDDFSSDEKVTLIIKVTYLDEGRGEFRLQYDSNDRSAAFGGVYKEHSKIVRRSDSGEWQTVEWRIDDARFKNGQNNHTDFRLYNAGDDLIVKEVRLVKE